MAASVELQLLDMLQDLSKEKLEYFKWYLQKDELLDGYPAIKKCHLEEADRLRTVDVMVECYSEDTMKVARMVLRKMKEGLGRANRKTGIREFPSNGTTEEAEPIYDLSISMVVKSAYRAEHTDELTLVKGSRVLVMEKCSNGWWRGKSGRQFGWFPSKHVLEVSKDEEASLACEIGSSSQSAGSSVFNIVQALYQFRSEVVGELNCDKGEIMELIRELESHPGWCLCRKANGLLGLVPRNYVVVLSGSPSLHADPAQDDKLIGKSWYFGQMTRHQANCELTKRGAVGDFLIRNSESSPSHFSISVVSGKGNKHLQVRLLDGVFCIGQRRFSSMDKLVEHYSRMSIYTADNGEPVYLLRPLPVRRGLSLWKKDTNLLNQSS